VTDAASDDARLPRTVRPRRYELVLRPDLDSATFTGSLRLLVDVTEPRDDLILNAAELSVEQARIVDDSGAHDCEISLDPDAERVSLRPAGPIGAGQVWCELEFSGTLNDKLRGFYRSTYTTPDGETKVIATTQFEPTDARRAFPCIDEPDAKAVFSITLEVPDGLLALSNTEIVSETVSEGIRRVTFADTVLMSTYLVAFVVGPLERSGPVDVDGTALSVVHAPGRAGLSGFALEVGAFALRFFADYFGRPYPLAKLDLVALPDFAMGAMENFGAVTFREQALLVDPERSSRLERERVADVICHELAHMWFGDLVTMRWWNGLWLNEAFATFMEMLAVDHYRPSWQRWVSFGRSRAAAMALDALSSTRPIEFPVRRPEDAEAMFDLLTYEKGAGVLRMVEQYLGAERFRAGIRRYLDKHAWGNAETTDLFDALEEATGEPVRSTMDSWVFQGGHPLVEVSAGPKAGEVLLRQRPFRLHPPVPGEPDAIGERWKVPVLLAAVRADGSREAVAVLLSDEEMSTTLPAGSAVVANAGGSGVYRCRYDATLSGALRAHFSQLSPLERFGLLNDTWSTTLAQLSPLPDLLALLDRLSDEDDPDVWSQAAAVASMLERISPPEAEEALARFVRRIARPALERIGTEARPGEHETTPTLRATLIGLLGLTGRDPEVRAMATARVAEAHAGGRPLEPDIAQALLNVAADQGDEADFDAFWERSRHASTPQEELRYLWALAAFRSPALVRRACELALSEVRTQNGPFLLQLLLQSFEGGPTAWAFVRDHFSEMLERFPTSAVPRMLEGLSALCRPGTDLESEIREFFEAHPLRHGSRALTQTLERLSVNVAFAKAVGPELAGDLATALSSS